MKRIFKVFFWIILALIILILLAPILFKNQIIDAVKKGINNNVNAVVDFEDADVSLLSDFPAISVELDALSIKGIDGFDGQTLLSSKQVSLSTDWKSVIKSEEGITISKIYLDEPFVNLIVDKSGQANYNITKESDTKSSDKSFFGNIEYYEIEDGRIDYSDLQNKSIASIKDINHSGTGAFKDVQFDLDTKTKVGSIDLKNGGVSYLKNAKLDADVELGIDLTNQKYTFKENVIKLNDLAMAFDGETTVLNNGFDLDIDVNAVNNSVASIISLIPNAYTKDFTDVKSTGIGSLKGTIKGQYIAEKNIFPKIDIGINLDNGQVQYPGLKLPIKDIFLDMVLKANNGNWNDLNVSIPQYAFLIDDDKMSGQLNISNALSDAHIIGENKGTLDLKKLSEAYPFEAYSLKSGTLDTDISIDAKQSDIENKNYNAINLKGDVEGENINLAYNDLDINIENIQSNFSPKNIDTKISKSTIGNSDFAGNIKINDPLYALGNDAAPSTEIVMRSNNLDIDQLIKMSESSSTADTSAFDYSAYKAYDVKVDYSSNTIKYEDYNISSFKTKGQYANNEVKINQSNFKLDDSPMALRGQLSNVLDYTFNEDVLKGEIFFEANELNANKYLNETGNTESLEEVVVVPKVFDLKIYPEIKKLIYDNYTLTNLDGKIDISEGIALLTDGSASLFNGKVNFDGAYDSSDEENPLFNFKYDVSKMNFGKFFETSESFKILAPLAKYVNGIFNSTLVISGPLKKDMFPDLFKIDASGFMETVNGKVAGFKPFELLSEQLGIQAFKNWDIKDSKNWFEIKDGYVQLKPHDYEFDGMVMTAGGKHSIDQNIDYVINAKIPREKLSKAQLGKTLEMGMSEIEKQATKRGVNIDLGDFVYLDIFITGSVLKPKIKILPVGSGGKTLNQVVRDEVKKQVEVLKDTLRKEVEKKTEMVKDTVTKVVKKETDKVKKVVVKKLEDKTDEVKDKVKDIIKDKVDSTVTDVLGDKAEDVLKDKAGDVLGGLGGSTVDSLKSKVKNWDPFKKKKKD